MIKFDASYLAKAVSIECEGEALLLHPDKFIYWVRKKTLLVADVHLGKEHVFGRASIAVPAGTSETTLSKLTEAIDNSKAERLLVLGDLVHGHHRDYEPWVSAFKTMLKQRPHVTVQVVAGNHDKTRSQELLSSAVSWINDCLSEPPFVFSHEPISEPMSEGPINDERMSDERMSHGTSSYVMAGHIHPAWRIKGHGKSSLRAPIFWFQKKQAILPAFGEFTGEKLIQRVDQDQIYLVGPDSVIPVDHNISV